MATDLSEDEPVPRLEELAFAFLSSSPGDQARLREELCELLGLDANGVAAEAVVIFQRRLPVAEEHQTEEAWAYALADTFILGITLGYELRNSRLDDGKPHRVL